MRTKSIEASTTAMFTMPGSVTVLEYQPGNGTRYILQITAPNPSNPTTRYVGLEGCYLVALVNYGACMTVADTGGYLSPGYVAEKLKIGAGDALVLAEIIAKHTGRKSQDASESVGV